ncbi:MAG: hypothetical protein QXO94_07315 [Candidatus Bathyarchaeia archaeon]
MVSALLRARAYEKKSACGLGKYKDRAQRCVRYGWGSHDAIRLFLGEVMKNESSTCGRDKDSPLRSHLKPPKRMRS